MNPIDLLLAEIAEGTGISTDAWSDDSALDATVPHWRFECSGAEAIAAELSDWYDAPITIDSAVRREIPGGEAVELDLSWAVDGDRISRDTVFCGGRWSAALLAEMEAARAH